MTLIVDDLVKQYPLRRSPLDVLRRRPAASVTALDGVSLSVRPHEIVAVVGESGSGKTTLARCLLRLEEPDRGAAALDGTDLLALHGAELRRRRRMIQMVFQDPYGSLSPRRTVAQTIAEGALAHGLWSDAEREERVAALLGDVGLAPAIARRLPHQLSGGERQRVAIARALAVEPDVLVADEAVSALDVSVQAQILRLLDDLRRRREMGILFITHQLSVVAQIADRVAVMYLGRIVESGPVAEVFASPRHPYTHALLAANPRMGAGRRRASAAVRGELPSAVDLPSGCRFRTRCPHAVERCAAVDPPATTVGPAHEARCHVLPESGSDGRHAG